MFGSHFALTCCIFAFLQGIFHICKEQWKVHIRRRGLKFVIVFANIFWGRSHINWRKMTHFLNFSQIKAKILFLQMLPSYTLGLCVNLSVTLLHPEWSTATLYIELKPKVLRLKILRPCIEVQFACITCIHCQFTVTDSVVSVQMSRCRFWNVFIFSSLLPPCHLLLTL